MKFTYMGFSQKKLVEYGLDLIDAAILRYFIDFKDTGKMVLEIHEDKPFYWVKYETLLEDNPIFNINTKDTLRKRFKKLTDANILIHYHKKTGGSYSFYGVGENYAELIADPTTENKEGTTQNGEGYDSKEIGGTTQKLDPYDSKVGTKDSSTKDSFTKKTNLLKHTPGDKKEIEKIVCVLDKKVTFEDAKKILRAANDNVDLVKEKYEVAKASDYRNLVAFILKAIKEDYQMPKKQENKDSSKSKVNTKFHNFEGRTQNYTSEQLEDIVLRKNRSSLTGLTNYGK